MRMQHLLKLHENVNYFTKEFSINFSALEGGHVCVKEREGEKKGRR